MNKHTRDLPDFITASMPVTFDVEEIVEHIMYNKDSEDVTLDEVKEYIQETYIEILSTSKSPARLSDEYGQSV